uniref:Digestive cysteine proteinase 3-like n=1 Tax=Diabrotica virgifera virgifera TaxID=50390 RepID=A0A6P7GR60_DIAVI
MNKQKCRDKNGHVISTSDAVQSRWVKHFKELFGTEVGNDVSSQRPRNNTHLEPPLVTEVRDAITRLKTTVGPVSMALNSSPLDFYAGGIVDGNCDPEAIDHGVLIVGYGSENGEDYWIVKNSWGSSFGENGFFRIKRGVNQCGLTYEVSYPLV